MATKKSTQSTTNADLSWRDAALAAREAVSALLFEASVRDEEERNDSHGMAKRLMGVANSEIGELVADATKNEFESAAFNVEAIIQGALALADDPVGPEVRGMLTHALVIIDRFTDVLCGGSGIEALSEAIATKLSPVPRVENNGPTARDAAGSKAPIDGVRNACTHLKEAVAVLEAYAFQEGGDICYGVCRLLSEAAEKAVAAKGNEGVTLPSDIAAQALAMLTMYAATDNDWIVRGAITLASLGKSELDEACERLA